MKRELYGATIMFLSALGFGALAIWAKFLFAENVSFIALLTIRSIMCAALLWVIQYIFYRHTIIGKRKDVVFALATGLFGYYFAGLFGLLALSKIDASVEALVFGSFPVMVILIEAMLKLKFPPLPHIIVLIFTQIGLYLTIGGNANDLFSQNLEGGIYAILSAVVTAVAIVMNGMVANKIYPLYFVTLSLTGSSFAAFIHFFIIEDINVYFSYSGKAWVYIMFSSITIVIGSILFAKGIKHIGSSRSALISTATPVFTVILAYPILGERLTVLQIMGGVIIILAVIMLEANYLRTKK